MPADRRPKCWPRREPCSSFIRTSIAPILNNASGRRPSVTTEPRTLQADLGSEEVIDMVEFGRELRRRRQAAGDPNMPRNSGKRRTASKRALLKAIEEAGGKW